MVSLPLHHLLGAVEVLDASGDLATEISAVVHDSRRVTPGALFCCLPGAVTDGHAFAADAVAAGAVALLCEREVPVDVIQVRVAGARVAMAAVADTFYDHPSRALRVVGVTGTNGKTTTTYLLRAALEAGGSSTEVIGTLTGARTTPEATDLQAALADARARGRQAVAMEVSSHALAQHRVDAMWFSAAVFTNLSHEHLDYHGTVEEYFRAKARLFSPERTALAVVNADDPYGRLLLDSAQVPTRPFSLADAVDLDVGLSGSEFSWEGQRVRLRMGGMASVANALAAAATARELGVPAPDIAAGLSGAEPVPGRFEAVDAGQPFTVLVDYAHTPAALEQLLTAARPPAPHALVAVFGCGGERDRDKRPEMGEVASRLADLVVVTSDNPRHEDPAAIIDAIVSGATGGAAVVVEPDRAAAIGTALARATAGDVVVIAGKGHETTQDLGDRTVPFDDRVVTRAALENL